MISPDSSEVEVGAEVSCTANGNPTPAMQLKSKTEGVELPQVEESDRMLKFMVPESWQGEQVRVRSVTSW